MKLKVCNSPSNQTTKIKIDLDKPNSLPAQVKLLPYDLTRVKIN